MTHHSNRVSAIFWGIALIITGCVILLHTVLGMDIGDMISDYWPLILVIIGGYLILKSHRHRNGISEIGLKAGDRSYVTDHENVIQSNTFGDVNVAIDTKDFQSGQIKTVFGDVKVDLSKLDIVEGERRLYLSAVFGDIKVNVPKDLPLKIYASNTAGDINIFDEKRSGFGQTHTFISPNYNAAKKKLFITISHTFGDTKIW